MPLQNGGFSIHETSVAYHDWLRSGISRTMKGEREFLAIRFRSSSRYGYAGVALLSVFCGFGLGLLFEPRDDSQWSTELNFQGHSVEKPEKRAKPELSLSPALPSPRGTGEFLNHRNSRITRHSFGRSDEDPATAIRDRVQGEGENRFSVGTETAGHTSHFSRGTNEIDRKRLPAWQRHAAKTPATGIRPKIAVVIDDLGIDRRNTERAIALRGPLTLSFLSYGRELKEQTARAREAGHELMVHVSMEPIDDDIDPGPQVLLTNMQAEVIRERLDRQLGRFGFFVGINNHMGSKFTADVTGMTIVMKELKSRGLLFLDSRTTSESVGEVIAKRLGVPNTRRSIFLDNADERAAVNAQLRAVEKMAMQEGDAVAIAHPRETTLEALEEWLNDLASRGFALVPISAIVASQEGKAADEQKAEHESSAPRPIN